MALTGVTGIEYYTQDEFSVFQLDLRCPNLSFEMVMAQDATSVTVGRATRSSPREFVRDMVARAPYAGRNPVLAFNADVFGDNADGSGDHGPEGLTVKNGVRFDGRFAFPPEVDRDGAEWKRSSLSISAANTVRIGKLNACRGKSCFDWVPTAEYYNSVGGGPLFVDRGARIGGRHSVKPCRNEKSGNIPEWYCTDAFRWTAAGVTRDGHLLLIAVSSQPKTMDEAAAVLIGAGAWRALKLDGGDSTQVWFREADPPGIVAGERPVANAMLVYSST